MITASDKYKNSSIVAIDFMSKAELEGIGICWADPHLGFGIIEVFLKKETELIVDDEFMSDQFSLTILSKFLDNPNKKCSHALINKLKDFVEVLSIERTKKNHCRECSFRTKNMRFKRPSKHTCGLDL